MIANPLNTTNNSIAALFPDAPDDSSVSAWNGNSYVVWNKDVDFGWIGPTNGAILQLNPGIGIFFHTPAGQTYTKTWVGEVIQNSTNPVPHLLSLKSSILPQQGKIETELLYPATDDDAILKWSGTAYEIYNRDVDFGWVGPTGAHPDEPVVRVAEGVFISRAGASTSWIRNFVP
jgi:hypothetical protein